MSLIKNYEQYLEALETSPTEMFWVIPDDVEICREFGFDIYFPPDDEYNRKMNHVFLNGNTYDGVMLMSKHRKISKKEFENRFPIERKEWDLIASRPKKYEIKVINSYQEYLEASKTSNTDMFWWVPNDVVPADNFTFDYYIPVYDFFHRNITHIFKNGNTYDGIVLFSKNVIVSEEEFNNRSFKEKKEVDIVASQPQAFEKFELESYQNYLDAIENCKTDMFWFIPKDVEINSKFTFDYYIPKYDNFHRNITHVFKNANTYDGIALFSKHNKITQKEFENRFYLEKKEVNVIASTPKPFPLYQILDFDDYEKILKECNSRMFWCIWPEIEITDISILNYYISYHDTYNSNENHVFKNKMETATSFYNGLVLFSKNKKISKKEFTSRYLIEKKEHARVVSKSRYKKYNLTSYEQYLEIAEKETQPMFWCIWPEVELIDQSVFDLYFDPRDGKYDFDRSENHVFKNNLSGTVSFINGIVLFSKAKKITKKEFDRRYIFEKKDHDKIVSKSRYPQYHIKNYDQYIEIASTTKSAMFWCIWPEIKVFDESVFDLYFDERDGKYDYDRGINHVFLNSCADNNSFFNGLVLCSTKNIFSKKEFDRRYVIDKKEHNVLVSKSVYPSYKISNYETYLEIIQTETQPMFWCIWPEVEILNDKVFDLYFDPKDGKYDFDRQNHHIFKNMCYEDASYHNGIVLVSKNKEISKKEFDRRYVIDKKEHDTVATIFRYSRYVIKDYEQYLEIAKKETQPMFWCIWPEVELIDQSVFDLYFDPRDGKYDFDRQSNHIFKNECAGNSSYFNGILLCSKNNLFSKKEFDRRYVIDKKEHDRTVSKFNYNRYTIDTYEDYLNAINKESQPMFWGIWSELEITNQSVFDLYFDPRDGKYDFDRQTNHVFSNKIGKDIDTDGIVLFNKSNPVSKKEIDFRFIIDKKMYSDIASETKLYDIVFISYKEINADENYARLLDRFPNAKRLHGVHGIHQAHIEAAKMASSHMFWVVDGDAIINNNFNFDYLVNRYERDVVYVWKSINPINDLIYGYGGVKLLPRDLTLKLDINSSDMTTSISKKFKAMPEVSNITSFNTDEFSTWRSAFRECVKLSSKTIDRQQVKETEERLNIWCSVGADRLYGNQAILGAKMGKKYGEENKNSPEALKKINDFTWLKELWEKNK